VHPGILCKHKLLFWMRLIAINRLTALIITNNTFYSFNITHDTQIHKRTFTEKQWHIWCFYLFFYLPPNPAKTNTICVLVYYIL